MNVAQYQRLAVLWIEEENSIDQIALVICNLFNLSHETVNNFTERQFLRYIKKTHKIFERIQKVPLLSRYKFKTNAETLTLGQFIEVQHFFKMGNIDGINYVLASIWKDSRDHKLKAEKLLSVNIRHVLTPFLQFIESYESLIKSYSGLFEIEEEEQEEEKEVSNEKAHPFIEQYGWIFSAKQIADHNGITLDQAYELPILQAFNDLAYLKSHQSYMKKISK